MTQNYRGATGLDGDWGIESLNRQSILDRGRTVQTFRKRFLTSEVNAGAELLPAVAGYKYQMTDCLCIAIGGAAATGDTVDVIGTVSTPRKLVAYAQASLTQSTVLRAGGTGAAVLADGASFTPNDADTAITVGKTGSNFGTATHFDVIFSYVLVPE